MYFASWVSTVDSAFFVRTFAAWTYTGMLIPHVAATTLGLMLLFLWGANYVTAVLAILLYATAAVSDGFVFGLYWRLGWNCNVRSGNGSLKGTDLIICLNENSYLITLWVIVSFLTIMAMAGVVIHGLYFYQTVTAGKRDREKRSIRHKSRRAGFKRETLG